MNPATTTITPRPSLWFSRLGALLMLLAQAEPAQAASLDGSQLSVLWAVPFVGIRL